MRQKLASVELGSPSLSLMRRNGFSPVRINLCGSATLISSPPAEITRPEPQRRSGVSVDCRQSLSAYADQEAHLFSPWSRRRNRKGGPAFQSVEGKAYREARNGRHFSSRCCHLCGGVFSGDPFPHLCPARGPPGPPPAPPPAGAPSPPPPPH